MLLRDLIESLHYFIPLMLHCGMEFWYTFEIHYTNMGAFYQSDSWIEKQQRGAKEKSFTITPPLLLSEPKAAALHIC